MAHHFITELLGWIAAHPNAAIAVVFVIAVAESIFLLGLMFPGAIFFFTFGALIGGHAMSLTGTFAAAIIGSLIGDSGSYALGRLYRGRLHELPGLSRLPGGVARAEGFFSRHGGKGIVLGRLIGAFRPIMPTVAGAAGLSIPRFIVMDVIATAIWAPIYIVPGMVFGASLDLAAQVATRLAILLLAGAAIVWGVSALVRIMLAGGRVAARRYAERLLAWSQRHRRLGLLGPALADPRQPEIPAMAIAASLLMAVMAVIYLALWGWQLPRFPTRFDAVAFYLIQSLHTPIANSFARVVAELGSPLVYLPFAAVISGLFAAMGNRRAAGHWVVAVGFSALVTLLLRWLLSIPAPVTFFHGTVLDPLFLAGGGQDLILCATVYGLAGTIIANRRSEAVRPYYYSATVAGVALIALARLYLGLDWASDSIIGLTVAFVWINLLVLCYRRQRPRRVRGRPVLGVLAGFVVVAIVLAVLPDNTLHQLPASRPDLTPSDLAHWSTDGYRKLPTHVRNIAGRVGAPLNVQAVGDPPAIMSALARAGWQPPPRLGPGQALRSLAPDTAIGELAVLPRVHDGKRATITLIHAVAGPEQPGVPARWVLRLWPTNRVTAGVGAPIWVGLVDAQNIDHELHMLTTASDDASYAEAEQFLGHSLLGHPIGHVRHGRPGAFVLLIWPAAATPASGGDAKVAPD